MLPRLSIDLMGCMYRPLSKGGPWVGPARRLGRRIIAEASQAAVAALQSTGAQEASHLESLTPPPRTCPPPPRGLFKNETRPGCPSDAPRLPTLQLSAEFRSSPSF